MGDYNFGLKTQGEASLNVVNVYAPEIIVNKLSSSILLAKKLCR